MNGHDRQLPRQWSPINSGIDTGRALRPPW